MAKKIDPDFTSVRIIAGGRISIDFDGIDFAFVHLGSTAFFLMTIKAILVIV